VPRLSVVVPIYDVEPFLDDCLDSLQGQTYRDFEVVMIDDGSHDRGPDIAGGYVELDRRFRLIRQENRGLGATRNVGVQRSNGELIAFLDSDDMVPADAYERLIRSLDRTGSDFAAGNIQRFNARRTWPSRFVAQAFKRTRRATHVTRYPPLLSDRMAQNKVWRRGFWDRHGLRFPEGVYHEDIPVVVPAHFRARTVDVHHEPVYLYRTREAGETSITQRRADVRVLGDRIDAVESVLDFLEDCHPDGWPARYAERVLDEDLRYHVMAFARGDAAYRAAFLVRAGELLRRIGPEPVARQAPADRRIWALVAAGREEELLSALEAAGDGASATR
jgi:CDP-glycerol glycerophosphotransferase